MTAPPVLSVGNLAKAYGGVHALDGVSFDVHAGELLALIGPNGAGKSTCFNVVNGQIRPDAGTVRLEGRDITGLPPRAIARLGVGRTFQIAAVFGSLTVLANVETALLASRGASFGLWRPQDGQARGEALDLLAQTGLAALADRPATGLAYGDVKRLELAIAIAGSPRLLLMDEPTAGMGTHERLALIGLVRRLAAARSLAVLFTEHSMDVVFGHATRVIVLARGRVIADGSVEEIRADPQVRAVYLGRSAATGERGS
ncbi:ABC transporter ATP-binding protein [Ancylobacter defluvii]|uniref:ABC transporter ATP-binding protein n=1 Tax=Ancylobacter defluvii TaxID=1282440 RepID=A0A9W6JVR3_9HYPH|nr:ABC transporter ATP-binding protein [Ancylobacter defluvii]MBS7589864.1 ABC transporter ATP-binding protein [Ancylobacter defluvii]GLK82985.1 ABC transporter ATP-binding protein [Ancylobacter defluvii]